MSGLSEAVGAGWEGGNHRMRGPAAPCLGVVSSPLCPSTPLCVQAGAVPHQGMEAAKAESPERLQTGMFLLSQVCLGNARHSGILRLLKKIVTGSGRAPVTFHLGIKGKTEHKLLILNQIRNYFSSGPVVTGQQGMGLNCREVSLD